MPANAYNVSEAQTKDRIMSTANSAPAWTDLWELSSDMLNCTECHAPQFMEWREFAFVHASGCSRQGLGQYPYLELLKILERSQQPE
jgi:hypothetical protein